MKEIDNTTGESVSVLIPLYNVRDYVERCLASVAAQSYRGPLECVLVDDCGNDGSLALAERFIDAYEGTIDFRIVHHEHNRGLAAARNTAVAAATGIFLLHLDSDDWLEPDAVERLVERQRETNADIVSGNAMMHGFGFDFAQPADGFAQPADGSAQPADGSAQSASGVVETLLQEPDYATPMEMVRQMIELTLDHVIWRRLIRKTLYTDNQVEACEGVNIGEDHHTLPRLAYYATTVATIDHVVYHYNCLNNNSYMASTASAFYYTRYAGNRASLDLLIDFFHQRSEPITCRLEEIRRTYLKEQLDYLCATGDESNYRKVASDDEGALPYPVARGVYWLRRVLRYAKRICGIGRVK